MTDTTTTSTDPVFARLDPRTLARTGNDTGAANIRTGAQLTPGFLASVKANGVRVPVKVIENAATGERTLRFGQRRVLAALEAGLDQIPALIYPSGAEADMAEAERIIDQWAENTAEPLTAGDKAAAVQQLLDLGIKVTEARARLGLGKDDMAAARKAGKSRVAVDAARAWPLTLTQAATLAEFDGHDAIQADLLATLESEPDQFDYACELARENLDDATRLVGKIAELEAAGMTVVTGQPPWRNRATMLAPAEGEDNYTAETHAACPGHVAYVYLAGSRDPYVTPFCTDPARYGHHGYQPPPPDGDSGETPSSAGEREAAEAAATAERRRVREGNKAWRAATTTRRKWLTTWLQRKTITAGQLTRALCEIAASGWWWQKACQNHHPLAGVLLGLAQPAGSGESYPGQSLAAQAMVKASPKRAQVITLALVLGAYEEQAGSVETWRGVSESFYQSTSGLAGPYLSWLETAGYTLSPVERAVRDGQRWEIGQAASERENPDDESV